MMMNRYQLLFARVLAAGLVRYEPNNLPGYPKFRPWWIRPSDGHLVPCDGRVREFVEHGWAVRNLSPTGEKIEGLLGPSLTDAGKAAHAQAENDFAALLVPAKAAARPQAAGS